MPLPLSNTLEGGSDTTTITTANSGGGSGDAFDNVTIDAASTLTYSTEQVSNGTLAAKMTLTANDPTYFGWQASMGSITESWGRTYFRSSALPGGLRPVMFGLAGVGTCGSIVIDGSGNVRVWDSADTGTTGTTVLSVDTTYRIEWHFIAHATTGLIEAKLFTGDSTTLLETITASNKNTRASSDQVLFGNFFAENPSALTLYFDSLAVNGTGYPGPFANPQKLRPVADSVIGAYTTQAGGSTNLFQTLDETSPSDADYVQSETAPVSSVYRFKIGSGTDPALSTGHKIFWRPSKLPSDGRTVNGTVRIYQGGGDVEGAGTLIATRNRNNVVAFTTFEETLSGAEADTITNYADLYGEVVAAQV